jgi:hypothetical protein
MVFSFLMEAEVRDSMPQDRRRARTNWTPTGVGKGSRSVERVQVTRPPLHQRSQESGVHCGVLSSASTSWQLFISVLNLCYFKDCIRRRTRTDTSLLTAVKARKPTLFSPHPVLILFHRDAAHSVHPLAGQGVNLGFGDAHALAAVIAKGVSTGRDIGETR